MYRFWLIIAWFSAFSSAIGLAIIVNLFFHIIIIHTDPVISVDEFLSGYMSYLYWIRGVAEWIFPDSLVGWVFGLSAIILFPIRFILSLYISFFAFAQARKHA